MRTASERLCRAAVALAVVAAALLPEQASAASRVLTVFACEPEWAALVRALLPDTAGLRLHVATHAGQDPHHIEARPALIAQLRAADLAVCTGAGLEAGWLPALQQRAGNPRVQDGAPGMFHAAAHVSLLDPRPGGGGNPFAGDVHAEGNPHLHADPRRLRTVARALARTLQAVAPDQAAAIGARAEAFDRDWAARTDAWAARAAGLRGAPVAAQHTSFGYLWDWLGLVPVADLEPRPGMAPTPGHLQALLDRLRGAPPLAVVVARHQDPRAGRWLTGQLGSPPGTASRTVPLLVLPATVEDPEAPDALGRWFDALLAALLQAQGAGGGTR